MTLTYRDRAKVAAAPVLIRDAGHDVSEITRLAETGITMGTPARHAYERAFNQFVAAAPAFHAPLQRLGQLIEASDTRTVSSYNVALSRYTETGDETALRSIVPALMSDMAEMARRTGDAGFADGLGNALPDAAPQPHRPATAPSEAIDGTDTAARPGWGPMGYCPAAPAQSATPAA